MKTISRRIILLSIMAICILVMGGCLDNEVNANTDNLIDVVNVPYIEEQIYVERLRAIHNDIGDPYIEKTFEGLNSLGYKELSFDIIEVKDSKDSLALFNSMILRLEDSEQLDLENEALFISYGRRYLVCKYYLFESNSSISNFIIIEIDNTNEIVFPYHIYVYERSITYKYRGEGAFKEAEYKSNYYVFGKTDSISEER